jgi:hypothetical protein
MPQTRIFSVDVIISPAMGESFRPGKQNPIHRLCDFAAMSEFVTENNTHRPWATEEDVLSLDLCRRDGPKSKFFARFIADRNSSQIKNRWHAVLKKLLDITLSNTDKMITFRSKILFNTSERP